MRTIPYDIYTPADTPDNEGGKTQVLPEAGRREIFGTFVVYENETRILVDAREEAHIGDIIIVEEE